MPIMAPSALNAVEIRGGHGRLIYVVVLSYHRQCCPDLILCFAFLEPSIPIPSGDAIDQHPTTGVNALLEP